MNNGCRKPLWCGLVHCFAVNCGVSAGLCGDLYCKLWKRKSVRKRCRHESCLAWNRVNYRKEKREKGG